MVEEWLRVLVETGGAGEAVMDEDNGGCVGE